MNLFKVIFSVTNFIIRIIEKSYFYRNASNIESEVIPVSFRYPSNLNFKPQGKLKIERGVEFSENFNLNLNGDLTVMKRSLIGSNSTIRVEFSCSISICEGWKSGHGLQILTEGSNCNAFIGKNFNCRTGVILSLYFGGQLKIEDNVFINNNSSIHCMEEIVIGENTLIGEGVRIYDHNHSYQRNLDQTIFIQSTEFKKDKITIGKNCWIGSNVVILKGVTIGNNTIIGAGNTIYKSIASDQVVKGAIQ